MSKDFKPQDYFRYKKLGKRWRKPKGLQSKMRSDIKGAGKRVKVGYRTEKKMRGLVRGLVKSKVVYSRKDIESLQKDEAIILASSLGKKKILEIAKEAEKRKISILNTKSVQSAKKREEKIKQMKELRKKAKKEEKKEKTEQKTEKKEERLESKEEKKI